MTKELFKSRLIATYLMAVAWTISGPVMKIYYGELPSWFFSVVGIWALVIGLSQKPLRKKFSVVKLLKMVIAADVIYILAMIVLISLQNIKGIIIFEEIIMGPYAALLIAADGKLDSFYVGKFKPYQQELIRSRITNNRKWMSILGFTISALLTLVTGVYGILIIQLLIMIPGVYLEIKAVKS